MNIDKTLRNDVIRLFKNVFKYTINKNELSVALAAIGGVGLCYMEVGGTLLECALEVQARLLKIKDENKRLEIMKALLGGQIVKIPGMRREYRLWGIHYNLANGKKMKSK